MDSEINDKACFSISIYCIYPTLPTTSPPPKHFTPIFTAPLHVNNNIPDTHAMYTKKRKELTSILENKPAHLAMQISSTLISRAGRNRAGRTRISWVVESRQKRGVFRSRKTLDKRNELNGIAKNAASDMHTA